MSRLNEKDLAARWGMTTRTLQGWRTKGIGPAYIRIGERSIFYRAEDVEAYEESCRVKTKDYRATVQRAASALDLLAKQAKTEKQQQTLSNLRDELRALLD